MNLSHYLSFGPLPYPHRVNLVVLTSISTAPRVEDWSRNVTHNRKE